MSMSDLPMVNALLNSLAVVLLVMGFIFVKRGNVAAHTRCMIGAFCVSGVFLVSYVTHYIWRAQVEGGTHTPFNHEGFLRWAYLLMLLTHIVLAMAVPILAILLIRLGLTRRYDLHRRVARFAYPIWMYVSVTGVLIYLALYHFNPPASP